MINFRQNIIHFEIKLNFHIIFNNIIFYINMKETCKWRFNNKGKYSSDIDISSLERDIKKRNVSFYRKFKLEISLCGILSGFWH